MLRLILALLLLADLHAKATPFDDLASPNPQVRDTAATKIMAQKLYHPTDSKRWKNAVRHLHEGNSPEAVLVQLRATGAANLPAANEIPVTVDYGFQLDDSWMLEAYFKEGTLRSWHLVAAPRAVEVPPPPHYTGIWLIYRLDGGEVKENFRDGESMPVF